jgi:hypothetical protein
MIDSVDRSLEDLVEEVLGIISPLRNVFHSSEEFEQIAMKIVRMNLQKEVRRYQELIDTANKNIVKFTLDDGNEQWNRGAKTAYKGRIIYYEGLKTEINNKLNAIQLILNNL